jgi:hypothetical protein
MSLVRKRTSYPIAIVHKHTSFIALILSNVQQQRRQQNSIDSIICRRQDTHVQVHELHFALCVVVRQQQHTTM